MFKTKYRIVKDISASGFISYSVETSVLGIIWTYVPSTTSADYKLVESYYLKLLRGEKLESREIINP